jgi:hypothetical protein
VTGTVPTLALTGKLPTQLGLTVTVDVVDGQVMANASDIFPCTGSAVGGGNLFAPATIAADGSFTLMEPAGSMGTVSVVIDGKTPATVGGDWSGSYLATDSNAGCTPFAGTFTAVPISMVSGTFAGTTLFEAPPVVPLGIRVPLTVVLQQGGPASLDPPVAGSAINSVSALSGTISVQGFSCFSSGTASIGSGYVFGDSFQLEFMMDDGSKLSMDGSLLDTAGSAIQVRGLLVVGGSCNGWSAGSLTTLTRE